MKTLTKKQRREIYLKSAANINQFGSGTICVELKRLSGFVHDVGMLTKTACDLFPEFATFKPLDDRLMWFSDYEQRVECLKKCAEMCKP